MVSHYDAIEAQKNIKSVKSGNATQEIFIL
jgi:hypothetical protein